MSESSGARSKRERYQFTWSSSARVLVQPAAESSMETDPIGVVEQGIAEPVDQIADALQAEEEESKKPLVDERSWKIFHTSPKSNGRPAGSHAPSGGVVRIGALLGWSGAAAVGAGLIMMNPGTMLVLRMGVLGAAWAGISAAIWFLVGKLAK